MANAYAELNIEQDTNEIEQLIYAINSFTANYFSLELVSQSQSEDIFFRLRKLLTSRFYTRMQNKILIVCLNIKKMSPLKKIAFYY